MSARIDEPIVNSTESGLPKRVTLRDLRRWRREGTVFPCLTAYDATMARWLSRAGVPVLLVGDSAAEVILGLPSTMHAPLDFLLQITAAVRRGAPNAFVIGDMPFLSYHAHEDDAVLNAGRFMVEGGADAVKLEADASFANVVKTTIFLTDLGDYAAVNTVYAEYFGDAPPARAAIQVSALPKNAKVEIEAIAVV